MNHQEFVVDLFENKERLISVLRKADFGSFKDFSTANNKHFSYIEGYLKHEGVTTLLFEFEYTDKDYMEDYSKYYSRCLKPYQKACVRIHAFKSTFEYGDFVALLQKEAPVLNVQDLQANYVGFIILRPIPHTPFGRTCLRAYASGGEQPNRFFPIIRTYKVHLYGIALSVESLAFQEQDKAVSACATSALWSAFQGTGILFHHHIPSPYEITQKATEVAVHYSNRSFPNKGLVPQQIAHAIRSVDLEALLVNVSNSVSFKGYLNAYLRGGIPVVMSMELFPYEVVDEKGNSERRRKTSMGLHAVTVTGFQMNTLASADEQNSLRLLSSRINKLYVHDDQIGPFAKMEFAADTLQDMTLSTKWAEFEKDRRGESYDEIRALPKTLFVPVYHKIRVPYAAIYEILENFTNQLYEPVICKSDLVWDIYLTTVSDLKEQIFNRNGYLLPDARYAFLTKTLPKYIWAADAYTEDQMSFSFYFDATDIENGYLFLGSLFYQPPYEDYFRGLAEGFLADDRITFHCREILLHYSNHQNNVVSE